jgi:twitching motility protein PilT
VNITELLMFSVDNRASDLHLSSGLAPRIRVDGELRETNLPPLEHQEVSQIIYGIMNPDQQKEFEQHLELDFSFELSQLLRFRVNVFNHIRGVGAVFRTIPSTVLNLHDLNLPSICEEIARFSKGLVLVTGCAGSGKSTTLAALIDVINSSCSKHILTIEDPVEVIHQNKKCLINQREVHQNTHSFNSALRCALREDPDVILIGELRDLETIRLAMTAAETGHLVLATLHTSSATQTINRIIDVFPAEEKSMVRSMLSESLQAVIAQILLKKNSGGRVAALEIMICTSAIRHLIREDKIAQMVSFIQTGQAKGMQTLDQHLMELVSKKIIAKSVARDVALDKSLFLT